MANAVPQKLRLEYGNYVVGGTSNRLQHNKYTISEGYEEATVSFNFIVTSDTAAGFADAVNRARFAFTRPDQRLLIRAGSGTLEEFSPTKNTGFNARPKIVKEGANIDTARSRDFSVEITFGKPADLTGRSGRRLSTTEVSEEPGGRKTITITGQFTALDASTALQQYNNNFTAFVAGRRTLIGGVYETTNRRFDFDDQNKVINFSEICEEIIFNQGSAGADIAEIVQQQISLQSFIDFTGDSPQKAVNRIQTVVINADMWIDKNLETDLPGFYDSTVKPYLISVAQAQLGLSTVAVVQQQKSFDLPRNRILTSITLSAVAGANVLEFNRTVELTDQSGLKFIPVHDKDVLAEHVFQGPAAKFRVTTDAELLFGSDLIVAQLGPTRVDLLKLEREQDVEGELGAQNAQQQNPAAAGPAGQQGKEEFLQEGWLTISKTLTETPLRIGDPQDLNFNTVGRVTITVEKFITKPISPTKVSFVETAVVTPARPS